MLDGNAVVNDFIHEWLYDKGTFIYGAERLYRVMVWGSHNDEFVLPQPAGLFRKTESCFP